MTRQYEAINGSWTHIRDRFCDQAVLVIGDLMLDHTWSGQARRLSPEAPVPVLTLADESYGLGGAANVARNLASLGATVRLAGVVGDDEDGERLLELCESASIDVAAAIRVPNRRTTRKTRFVTDQQQLLRADVETSEPLHETEEQALIAGVNGYPVDAVVLSDYAKGVVTQSVIDAAVERASRAGVPCVVDPKGVRFDRYAGCTVITPNAAEAEAATGLPVRDAAEGFAASRELLETTQAEAVAVTHGRHGVYVVTAQDSWHLPAHAEDVFDVAGAGDTLVAVMTLSLAAGTPLPAAVAVANVAAGLVVQSRGVATTTREELTQALAASEIAAMGLPTEHLAA